MFFYKKVIIFLLGVILLTFPLIGLAQAIDVEAIIERFIDMIVWPAFVTVVVIMFLWAGVLYLTAQGEPGKIQTANKSIIWALVGIIVGILAFSIQRILCYILGVSC